MSLLESKSVQMMLTQLLKAAAPQLSEQVEQVAQKIVEFAAQQKRIEDNQIKILELLNGQRTGNERTIEFHDAGSDARGQQSNGAA